MTTYFQRPDDGWTPIPNTLIHHPKMTPIARLVLMHALSNRADWEEPAWRIAEALDLSRDRVTKSLNELAEAGFARKTISDGNPSHPPRRGWDFAWPSFDEASEDPQVTPKAGFSRYGKTQLREDPQVTLEDPQLTPKAGFSRYGKTPQRQNPSTGNPSTGNPSTENPAPLQDCSSNQTGVHQDQGSNNNTSRTAPEEHASMDNDEPFPMINFNEVPIPASRPTRTASKARSKTKVRTDDPDFEEAWNRYGYKVGRANAVKAWAKAMAITTPETVLAAIDAYVESSSTPDEPERQGSYWRPRRAHLATWLNAGRWTDEIAPRKTGYQGEAGSDAQPGHVYLDVRKKTLIHKLVKYVGVLDEDMALAWYWHWNHEEQQNWTVEQLLATGNTPKNVARLKNAYENGIDPGAYARFMDNYGLTPDPNGQS